MFRRLVVSPGCCECVFHPRPKQTHVMNLSVKRTQVWLIRSGISSNFSSKTHKGIRRFLDEWEIKAGRFCSSWCWRKKDTCQRCGTPALQTCPSDWTRSAGRRATSSYSCAPAASPSYTHTRPCSHFTHTLYTRFITTYSCNRLHNYWHPHYKRKPLNCFSSFLNQ